MIVDNGRSTETPQLYIPTSATVKVAAKIRESGQMYLKEGKVTRVKRRGKYNKTRGSREFFCRIMTHDAQPFAKSRFPTLKNPKSAKV